MAPYSPLSTFSLLSLTKSSNSSRRRARPWSKCPHIFTHQFFNLIGLAAILMFTFFDPDFVNSSYVVVDTPGQIEAFSQSASGQIITESFGCTFPTVSLYIADTVRCENPNTFMSNMLYSLSILYKTKLPLIVVFNKIDVLDHSFAEKWMKDFDDLDASLGKCNNYLSSLSRSMSLVLEEFYSNILSTGVSAVTGKGFDDSLLETFT